MDFHDLPVYLLVYLLLAPLTAGSIVYLSWTLWLVLKVTPEERAANLHKIYAHCFDLEEKEKIIGAWCGLEYRGKRCLAGHAVCDALNDASAAVIGVSTYVPNVQIALTSNKRLLISREYSDFGERGNFKQHTAFAPGTEVLDGNASHPSEDLGTPPKHPFNPRISLEFVQLRSKDGQTYDAWLSPQGIYTNRSGSCSLLSALTN